MRITVALFPIALSVLSHAQTPARAELQRSAVSFVSDAPLERIEASTASATGLLDEGEHTFAVKIPVRTFQGFNSPLQQEHFVENYMECDLYPNATFSGRIIEAIDLSVPGTSIVRAKGRLVLHGISQERIIQCQVVVTPKGIRVTSTFDVLLSDHAIRIPRVVQQKLAGTVHVKVDMLFVHGSKGK